MSDYIENSVKIATKISNMEYVQEEFRESTYRLILGHLLNKNVDTTAPNEKIRSQNGQDSSDFKEWEQQLFENLPKASIASKGNRNQQTIWAAISLYFRGLEVTTESIRMILKDELGITPQSDKNTSQTLKKLVPDYLNRKKKGKVYIYCPTRNALNAFKT